jgi:hypothetical protein
MMLQKMCAGRRPRRRGFKGCCVRAVLFIVNLVQANFNLRDKSWVKTTCTQHPRQGSSWLAGRQTFQLWPWMAEHDVTLDPIHVTAKPLHCCLGRSSTTAASRH